VCVHVLCMLVCSHVMCFLICRLSATGSLHRLLWSCQVGDRLTRTDTEWGKFQIPASCFGTSVPLINWLINCRA